MKNKIKRVYWRAMLGFEILGVVIAGLILAPFFAIWFAAGGVSLCVELGKEIATDVRDKYRVKIN